jgi:ATP-dependent RNA helicase DDX47/RRP3
VTMVTQYDIELVQRIEKVIDKKMELWPSDAEEIALLKERVGEAGRVAIGELREQHQKGGIGAGGKRRKKDDADRDDDEVEAGMPSLGRKSKRRR